MTVVDDPIERLNYFNGLRLAASDLLAEQTFHIDVRRRLTAALFSPGIATGLEVTPAPNDAHRLVVSPGVAIDSQGREIILVAPQTVLATGTPSTQPGVVFGNYLVIAYGEDRAAPVDRACMGGAGVSTAAPSRIVLDPQLSFQDSWPSVASGLIVLCQVELDPTTSQVVSVLTGMRKYVTASKPPQTTPISLEGEKDIDADNAKVVRFHITGGVPGTATLYLFGDKFSSLYYTELGQHSHDNTLSLDPMPDLANHTHPLGALTTDKQLGGGAVQVSAETYSGSVGDFAVRLWNPTTETTNLSNSAKLTLDGIEHAHTIAAGGKTSPSGDIGDTTPKGTLTNADTGAPDLPARTGASLGYLNGLLVSYDTQDITDQVLKQINDRLASQGQPAWPSIGAGLQADVLNTDGSGPIDLIALGLDLSTDQHTLTFSVPSGGGGKVYYNLYVS